ncbi:MAG: hypothetical protein Q4C70_11200, partial [Planctomycetia bacterium]|nr:hypothetical protein [Planctomycetia bacterium]
DMDNLDDMDNSESEDDFRQNKSSDTSDQDVLDLTEDFKKILAFFNNQTRNGLRHDENEDNNHHDEESSIGKYSEKNSFHDDEENYIHGENDIHNENKFNDDDENNDDFEPDFDDNADDFIELVQDIENDFDFLPELFMSDIILQNGETIVNNDELAKNLIPWDTSLPHANENKNQNQNPNDVQNRNENPTSSHSSTSITPETGIPVLHIKGDIQEIETAPINWEVADSWYFLDMEVPTPEEMQKSSLFSQNRTLDSDSNGNLEENNEEEPEMTQEEYLLISSLFHFLSENSDRQQTNSTIKEETTGTSTVSMSARPLSFIINSPKMIEKSSEKAHQNALELLDASIVELAQNNSSLPTPPALECCHYHENRERFFELLTLLSETFQENIRMLSAPQLRPFIRQRKKIFHYMIQQIMQEIMDADAGHVTLLITNFTSQEALERWEIYNEAVQLAKKQREQNDNK